MPKSSPYSVRYEGVKWSVRISGAGVRPCLCRWLKRRLFFCCSLESVTNQASSEAVTNQASSEAVTNQESSEATTATGLGGGRWRQGGGGGGGVIFVYIYGFMF